MEERKLNFGAPLLSVRRSSKTKVSSDGAKAKKLDSSQLSRHQKTPSNHSDSNLDLVTEPVAVPFQWEQIPGIRKDGGKPRAQAVELASNRPATEPKRMFDVLKQRVEKRSQGQSTARYQTEVSSFNASVAKLDCSKDRPNNEKAVELGNEEDDGDDFYSDALETLSPTYSFSMNCSASGLSHTEVLDAKPSGTFSTDQQIQDFMMSRFLPAAKAMTIKPPHYATKKQPVAVEQSRQIVKVVNVERKPPVNRSASNLIPYTGQDIGNDDSSEDEYDDHESSAQITTKVCSLLPRLCFKNSLSILNPVPGMKVRNHTSMSSAHEVVKPSKATCSRSQSPIKKFLAIVTSKQKPVGGNKSPHPLETESKLAFGSNRFTHVSERRSMSRTSSPLRRSGVTSPHRNSAPQSPFRGRVGYSGSPNVEHLKANRVQFYNKGGSKSQELFPHHVNKQWSCPFVPAIEKTLYIDTVNKAQNSYQGSGSTDFKQPELCSEKDRDGSLKSREMKVAAAEKTYFQDAKCLEIPERKRNPAAEMTASADAGSPINGNKSPLRGRGDIEEDLAQDCKALVCIGAVTADRNLNDTGNQISKDGTGNAISSFIQSPAPPLLPKTPSESWLWRTLPSLSSRYPFSNVYRGASFHSKWQDSKPADTKWETIVKSSYMHHDHFRYSEELVPQASKQSKR